MKAISDGTKKIRGLISDINDGINSYQANLNTISTVTESCAKYDFNPDALFIIYNFEVLSFFKRKNIIENQNNYYDKLFLLFLCGTTA